MLEVDSAHQTECSMKAIRNGYGLLCFCLMKNVSCEYDRWVVETQLCKLRDTRTPDTLIGHSYVCVLHIKPFFLPVNIRHTQCPCRFFLLEIQALWWKKHDRDTTSIDCNAVVRIDNAMTERRANETAVCRRSSIGRFYLHGLVLLYLPSPSCLRQPRFPYDRYLPLPIPLEATRDGSAAHPGQFCLTVRNTSDRKRSKEIINLYVACANIYFHL